MLFSSYLLLSFCSSQNMFISSSIIFIINVIVITVLLFFFNGYSFPWCFHFINAPMVVLFWSLIYSLCFEISSSHFIVLSSCLWVFISLNLCSYSVQLLSRVQLFATPWTSLSITNSWSLPKLMSIELVMPSNHPILCCPLLLLLQSFPASGSFHLTFQVPMQYCSLQHGTLLLSPVTSTTGCCFCFGSVSLFFLELFLRWSPVVYWVLTNLGSSSLNVLSFCLFILFMGFSRQEYWSGLPFPSPVDRILSELSTMSHLSWVALHGMAYSLIELDKAVVHVTRLVSCLRLCFLSVCPLMPSLGVYRLTGVSLTLDLGYLLKAGPAKHSCHFWPWMWDSSSRPL